MTQRKPFDTADPSPHAPAVLAAISDPQKWYRLVYNEGDEGIVNHERHGRGDDMLRWLQGRRNINIVSFEEIDG